MSLGRDTRWLAQFARWLLEDPDSLVHESDDHYEELAWEFLTHEQPPEERLMTDYAKGGFVPKPDDADYHPVQLNGGCVIMSKASLDAMAQDMLDRLGVNPEPPPSE